MQKQKTQLKQKALLIITDGIGYKPDSPYNAFYLAKKPTYNRLFQEVPYSMIRTYGEDVGLPEGQMGNSEVGHMTLGSGRILYQDLVKINKAIQNGELAKHKILLDFAQTCKRVHLIGLLSDGGVHSHMEHSFALAEILQNLGVAVCLHLITDGRDVPPKSMFSFLDSTLQKIQTLNTASKPAIQIATISGRFYAMDRDKRWERVQLAYESIALAENPQTLSPKDYLQKQIEGGITDEFIEPASFNNYEGFKQGDGILFTNFRSDRAREIVNMLGEESFNECERRGFLQLKLATMTCYDENFSYPILFPKEKIRNTLAEIFAQKGLTQLHTAETEKYAHVTFFFNGGIEKEYQGEKRVLIPSPNVKTYDLQPEMSAKKVGDAVIEGLKEGFDFIVVNFANGDMVGHTGNLQAAIKAVESVDAVLGKILQEAKKHNYAWLLTSDHGNCEEMADSNGNPLTNHTVGDVWCFVDSQNCKTLRNGSLANIAPTLLEMMGLEIPKEMEKSLICD